MAQLGKFWADSFRIGPLQLSAKTILYSQPNAQRLRKTLSANIVCAKSAFRLFEFKVISARESANALFLFRDV